MRIAVDAMGGDNAPRDIVAGAIQATEQLPDLERIYLVGRQAEIEAVCQELGKPRPAKIEIVDASEVVGMDESPATAIRRKKDSSVGRAVALVKDGQAQALFTAGNTGAAVAATTLKLRTLEGIARPAIATVMPTKLKPFVLIDAGANTDCTARQLAEFAVMGSVYSQEILGIDNPTVGLLSIGGEATKGNEATKEAYALLQKMPLNFKGNVEGHDLYEGATDVVVCDGFVGNVVLKTSESAAHAISHWLKEEFTRNPIRILGALLLKRAIGQIKQKGDPSVYGGAPLLGVNGICIIGHGSSSPFAVFNGVRVACESVSHDINGKIIELRKAGLTSPETEA
jgi:phosphate acyltransferase